MAGYPRNCWRIGDGEPNPETKRLALAYTDTGKASEAYRRLKPNSPNIALFGIGFVGLTGQSVDPHHLALTDEQMF
jgi:hypothetical protein